MFDNSIIIVAHPDDEVLWFSSILRRVAQITFCFLDSDPMPNLGPGRQKALSEYPIATVTSLNVKEANTFGAVDWRNPVETPYGLEIGHDKVKQRYEANYHALHEQLSSVVAEFENVFTHNPWGDYGHADHVQVYRVIKALQAEHHFNLWYSNYCSDHSLKLTLDYISGFRSDYVSMVTDPELAREIADLYKRHGCWTWYEDYEWFHEESFIRDMQLPDPPKPYGHIFPLNMIKTPLIEAPLKRRKGTVERVANRIRLLSKRLPNRLRNNTKS